MKALRDLPNISTVVEKKLMDAGIASPDELYALGSKEAFLRIKLNVDPGACKNMLYGLEGAVRNIRWHDLDQSVKEELKQFYNDLK